MDNKEKQAIEKLLKRKGYTVYEIKTYYDTMIIEGSKDLVDYGYEYEFEVDISLPIVRNEGKSGVDMIIERIEDYKKDIDFHMEELSENKEFESKQYANKILTEMFERGIKEETDVCFDRETVGRKEGKTSTVTYIAQKYNLPIVVSNNVYKNLFKKIDENLEVYTMGSSLAGLDTKIVLVDELETKHIEDLTARGHIVIGIVR